MERLKRMAVFAKVVEQGSFTAVAQQMQVSVSSISQTISRLENELNIKLLNRSTRRIGMTEAGKIYYQGCQRMLNEATRVHEQLFEFNNTPVGTLRIGSSTTMAQNVLAPIAMKLLADYPGLEIDLITDNPTPDLITHGLDLVLRTGHLENSTLFSRQIGAMPMVICASKEYLSQVSLPTHHSELASLCWLEYTLSPYNEMELTTPDGEQIHLSLRGRFATNDPQTLVHWLRSGAGIAYMPMMWIMDEVKQGNISILLPDYSSKPRPVHALYTEKDKLPLKVQICLSLLAEYFKEMETRYELFLSKR
ncbi:HTH-type transcriptional activator AaeR [Rosenbergiella nectarea]|uniref:HTH-type transcriptional activator AaeR n=1 Tax=Rosenbergiella nectarea TaxID=988801 RepID=UPI001F4E4641|nr:HTH-type transcriptional activator AaeR [Rosenbergiella nectarea]